MPMDWARPDVNTLARAGKPNWRELARRGSFSGLAGQAAMG